MADRTVTYTFRGNFASLTAGLAASGKGVVDLGTKLTALDKNGVKMRAGLTQLGTTAGKAGLLAAAGVAAVVKTTADFEQAMSNVGATGAATSNQLDQLRAAALAAGQTTRYSATEAAGGIESLLKAGVSASDVIGGGLKGALDLAAAGQLSVSDAADLAATALTQFKLQGSDVGHVADLLAAGANTAQGDVSDLGMALQQSGLVASQFGLSVDDTVTALTAFASAGLLGSDAGTSFKQLLLSLANPSAKASTLMQQLGISAYDAQGKFVGLAAFSGQLHDRLGDLTTQQRNSALATIFGSDAIRAASVLYDQGASGIGDYNAQIEKQGYAADVASKRMQNLYGDLHKLSASLQTALIGAGEGSQGSLRALVQDATAAVNAFNALPGPVKSSVTALAGITAVVGGGLFLGSRVISGINNTRVALDELGISASGTTSKLGRIGASAGAILVAGQAIGVLVNATTELGNVVNSADIDRNLQAIASGQNVDSLTTLSHALEGINEAGGGTANAIFSIGSAFTGIKTSFATSKDTVEEFDQSLAQLVESGHADEAAAAFQKIRAAGAANGGVSDHDVVKSFDAYATALHNIPPAASGAASAIEPLAAAQKLAASASDAQAKAAADAVKAMRDQRNAALGAFDAETQYRQAVTAAAEQAKKSQAGLKGNSAAAIANRGALSQLAAAWNNQSDAVQNNVGKYQAARANFVSTAEAMGVPKQAAIALARSLLNIPESRATKVTAHTGQANSAIDGVRSNLANLRDRTIHVHTVTDSAGVHHSTVDPHAAISNAAGGPIRTATFSDDIPAYLKETAA